MNWLRKLFGLCEHQWGKWRIFGERPTILHAIETTQIRQCAKCGLSQFKTTRY